jgi:hypothetical protein
MDARALASVVLLAVLAGPLGCARQPPGKAAVRPSDYTLEQLNRHIIHSPAFWREYAGKPLSERVIAHAPPEMLDYWALDNLRMGLVEVPQRADPSAAFIDDLKQAVAGLPPSVQRLFAPHLVAICLVGNLGGTAAMNNILADGKPVGSFLVLDPGVLDQPANSWAAWKEASAFIPDPAVRIALTLEPPETNDRRHAIEYILLHELAHLVAVTRELHPSAHLPNPDSGLERYPFVQLSWTLRDRQYVSFFDAEFPLRAKVRFYGPLETRLPAAEADNLYAALAHTSLPSLYAVTGPFEDFAESFASYVHVVVMKRPWRLEVYRDGVVSRTLESCWGQERCAAKAAFLAALLAGE